MDEKILEKNESSFKTWLIICCLALTVFIFVTTSLMPMGLLPDIAVGMGKTEARTGLIVSAYAWVSAGLTLPLTIVLAGFSRRILVLTVLTLFVASHLLTAWAQDFSSLIVARILTASAHAVLWGLATPTAVRLAPEDKKSTALAVMATGVSLSAILGVPLGTLLGQQLGWRSAFLAVGLMGLVLMLVLAFLMPKMPSDNSRPRRNLSAIVARPVLWRVYTVLFLSTCGHAAAFTYFTPFMRTVGGFSSSAVVNLLLLFGLAGVAGGFVGSALTGRRVNSMISLSLLLLALNLFLAPWGAAVGPAGSLVITLIWGLVLSGLAILYQSVIFKAAPEATDLVMSMYAVFFNLGIGGGAFIGSRLFEQFSIQATSLGGAAFMALALVVYLLAAGKGRLDSKT